jgi:hypothetical protein
VAHVAPRDFRIETARGLVFSEVADELWDEGLDAGTLAAYRKRRAEIGEDAGAVMQFPAGTKTLFVWDKSGTVVGLLRVVALDPAEGRMWVKLTWKGVEILPEPEATASVGAPSALQAGFVERLLAALDVPEREYRDNTLGMLALHAADEAEMSICLEALEEMGSGDLKSRILRQVALIRNEQGHRADAVGFARMIPDAKASERVIREIAVPAGSVSAARFAGRPPEPLFSN